MVTQINIFDNTKIFSEIYNLFWRYRSKYATLILFCEICFVLCMVFFFGREMRNIYRERGSYFTQFWNLIELFIILVSALAVAFYFYREKISRDLFAKMPSKEPQNYISFQFAAYWDQTYSGIIYFAFLLKICLLK